MFERNRIYNEDCLGERGMCLIPDKSVDMILCDLPYGTTACAWDSILPFDELWTQYKRIIKDDGAIVLTATQPFTTKLIASNIEMFKYEWIWEKTRITGYVHAKNAPMRAHENILIFSKYNIKHSGQEGRMKYFPQGLKPYNKIVNGSKNTKRDREGHRIDRPSMGIHEQEFTNYPNTILKFETEDVSCHPTQKPVALFKYLIETYTNEGDTVLDNTIGSGTTAVASIQTRRNFIGFEKDLEYHRIANERIANVQSALFV